MYTRGRCRRAGVTCLRNFLLFVCGAEWESRRNTSLCRLQWRDFPSVVSGWFLFMSGFCCWFLLWEVLAKDEKLREEAEKFTFRRNFLRFWAQILWFETYTSNLSSELSWVEKVAIFSASIQNLALLLHHREWEVLGYEEKHLLQGHSLFLDSESSMFTFIPRACQLFLKKLHW